MSEEGPDYSKGKIYKLICDDEDVVYIGSTTQELNIRLSEHRSDYNNGRGIASKELFDIGNVSIKIIVNYPCNSSEELRMEEQEWIDTYTDEGYEVVNIKNAYISEDEIKERNKGYELNRGDRKEYILKKI